MTITYKILNRCYTLLYWAILTLCFFSLFNLALAAPVTFNFPAQALSQSLKDYGRLTGVSVAVDSKLVEGKNSKALKGNYEPEEALRRLLEGTGLRGVTQGDNIVIERKPALPSPENLKKSANELPDVDFSLDTTEVRAKRFKDVGPLPGLALTKEQIPGNIQSITAKEIKEAHSLSLSDLLNSKLQSVNVNDYQGNPFQMDVTYRGFTASPQLGSPQGLSVFFDGIRVNEPFGDVVNWDMIPMNALGGFDVFPGSNPIFGLNTLGGALSMKTKSGFTDPGVSMDVLTGSYGRRQLQASAGVNNGNVAAFGAVNLFMEDGWRKNSPSEVNQAFGKLEWQGERASLALSSLAAVNKLVGNGTVPQELYSQDPSAVFTSPDITRNRLLQFQLSGAFEVNDTVNITGMMYSRNSDRISKTGDIIDFENFNYTPGNYQMYASRRAASGETVTCALADSNRDGVPNFIVLNDADVGTYLNGNTSVAISEANGATIPADLLQAFKDRLAAQPIIQLDEPTFFAPSIDGTTHTAAIYNFLVPGIGISFNDGGVLKHVFAAPAINAATCANPTSVSQLDGRGVLVATPATTRDGANDPNTNGQGTGVVAGTPTAIITNSNISQSSQGLAMQVNFNLDQHKLMVGTAFDWAKAAYNSTQRLALLDNNRNVYSDSSQLGEEYYYADHDATINDFNGKSLNQSLYASETWSPTQNLNITASGRYNYSEVTNTLAPRIADRLLVSTLNRFITGSVVCPGNDIANCPISLTSPQEAGQNIYFNGNPVITLPAQTEKFSYHKLNPALGITWQAKPNLNIYSNWNQGTRVPSVIELGCAYDGTLVSVNGQLVPRSILEGRGCSLPSALSGDPYLPQVVARTVEVGARGKFRDFAEWNISAYRTDVKDDIYLTSLSPELSFFQSIGATLRQGIEFGMAGEYGRSNFRVNYSLTDATFQSSFRALSPNNSSRSRSGQDIDTIQVSPGNVMPGVPFNNMNFNWGYKVTPKLKFNASVVAHSDSFLRGNENNAHTPSQGATAVTSIINGVPTVIQESDNNYPGKAPGYAVLNINARYDLGQGWAVSLLVNNVLDKTYYTAGRLGLNPFAPSVNGAIGPGGFNYNSSEWIPSQFVSAGAPRGIWVSLSYDFAKGTKPAVTQSMAPDPDHTLDQPNPMPNAEEVALAKQLDTMSTLPVLKQMQVATQTAREEVALNIEQWRKAQAENNAEAYLNSYAKTYAPAGISHNQWAEKQKLQFMTEQTVSVELSDIWIEPKDKKMVAVFNQTLSRNNTGAGNSGQVYVRKILSFEQKQGQWVIVRENALSSSNMAKFNKAGANSNQTQTSSIENTSQPKASNTESNADQTQPEIKQTQPANIKTRLKRASLNMPNKTWLNEATKSNAVLAEVK